MPSIFSTTRANGQKCKNDGTFKLEGTLSKDIKNELNFDIPLIFPD